MEKFYILSIVGVALSAGLIYFIARYLKGSIKIVIPRSSYSAGESIKGRVLFHAKKRVEANHLKVSLVCQEVTGRGKHKRTREIYRDDLMLDGQNAFDADHRKAYDFEINLPPDASNPGQPRFGDFNIAGFQFQLLGRRRYKWSLKANLDATGVDLSDRKLIIVAR